MDKQKFLQAMNSIQRGLKAPEQSAPSEIQAPVIPPPAFPVDNVQSAGPAFPTPGPKEPTYPQDEAFKAKLQQMAQGQQSQDADMQPTASDEEFRRRAELLRRLSR